MTATAPFRAETNRAESQNSAVFAPGMVKKPCMKHGCRNLTETGGRCKTHALEAEHARGKTAARGYDADFRALRVACFTRDEWKCVDCGWEPQLVRLFREAGLGLPPAHKVLEELRLAFARYQTHLHADHQIPVEERPDLRLDLDNLRTRCNRCHALKTRAENPRARVYRSGDGPNVDRT